jgi:hypothetical protein
MTTRLGVLASLLLLLPGLAHATLQAAVSLDGGPSLLACDQNTCAGGAVPTILDVNAAVGVLTTAGFTLGDLSINAAVQTSVQGPLNTLSSGGTVIQNLGDVPHTILLTISDTNFLGPASQFTLTGSGTWVDPIAPVEYNGSAITMAWWNDAANTQGAQFAGDTPGVLLATAMHTPLDGIPAQSFGGPGGPFNVSGVVLDPADFSMTLDNTLVLGPGIRLESRGQALSKPVAVSGPATAWLVGLGLLGMARRARGDRAR